MIASAGNRLREAAAQERPLQVVGVINALCAMLAERAGFRAVYLSGAGVANAAHGLPDLGMTSLNDVVEEARRITAVTNVPLLVDIDTGWGSPLTIQRAIRELTQVGVAGVHLEDQVDSKRCGHRPGKQLVSTSEMKERVQAAGEARPDPSLVIMARTDAAAVEGIDAAILRSNEYVQAGADMIFAEALTSLEEYRRFASAISVPVLANCTEFGKTPLLTRDELGAAGVRLVLYPLTAFRAMNAAAANVYATLRREGSQRGVIDQLQTRADLYDLLNYEIHERLLDQRTGPETINANQF